jgi:3,4-dihydroxy 2-butanone 4-phosphate synthase/GTP cyclohydrolase II
MPIERVKEAIESIKRGEMVVMIDDEDRENEGDLVYASNFSTPQKVNFMATHGKGLICVALSEESADRLNLKPMVSDNTSSYETAFTISVDAREASTGISASERDMTIKILANPLSKAEELVQPGHIFPLIAKSGGTLFRTGHTEGSVDLCRLAGLQESAVICEIMREDGEMARRDDLMEFSKEHNLKIVYISDLVEYRLQNESLVNITEEKKTEFYGVEVTSYRIVDNSNREHRAIRFYSQHSDTTVKFHHIGRDVDLLTDSRKFNQLQKSISYLKQNGGVLVFLDSKDQDEQEVKEYGIGAQILKLLGVEKIKLLTSSSAHSFVGINGFGLQVVEEILIED